MSGKSFSDRLSWRIIGIVLVVSLLAQMIAAFVIADQSIYPMDWWRESPKLLIYMGVIAIVSFIVLFFVSRGVIKRSTRYSEELESTTAAKERMELDLAMARGIQKGMLRTDFPPFLFAMLNPAKEVGGDLYDYSLKGDQLYFAIGDVSGKGVPASLVMAITSAALHVVGDMGLPMNETLCRINDSFSETNKTGMFVTMFVARLDIKTGHMDYCNAGHNPILVIPPDAEPYLLKSKPNIALGISERFPYEAEQIDFKLGTRIIAYTDGVTEAESSDKSQYGNERLMAWAKQHVDSSPETLADPTNEKAIVESLCQSVCDFTKDNPQNDDITIMSIKLPIES